ncbi:hypothetical protein [Georgenia sp. H159]|uniref:hypothetical protein n=1 Tax=Georgenia sp. H159 TaxID=3076115 RepID=UPI002D789584|nr:hypothetical protein [Georgenia sp. H159]
MIHRLDTAEPGTRRALLLLLLFVLSCAAVAAVTAAGLGTVWHELYSWALPQVVGDQLPS